MSPTSPTPSPNPSQHPQEEKSDRQRLLDEVRSSIPQDTFLRLLALCKHLKEDGLSIEEAATASRFPIPTLNDLFAAYPSTKEMVDLSILDYKKVLLASVNKEAPTNPKMAQWLLERKFREEFSSSSRSTQSSQSGDAFEEAIIFIRKNAKTLSPFVTAPNANDPTSSIIAAPSHASVQALRLTDSELKARLARIEAIRSGTIEADPNASDPTLPPIPTEDYVEETKPAETSL